ncbi:MAG: hypothetical protein BWK80_00415 [Desulfobacteraceae bacterium IS3]|nr:MAG: hypothetical protein BWK80_00415 [Desulfobacteraceae bacterium IS3]
MYLRDKNCRAIPGCPYGTKIAGLFPDVPTGQKLPGYSRMYLRDKNCRAILGCPYNPAINCRAILGCPYNPAINCRAILGCPYGTDLPTLPLPAIFERVNPGLGYFFPDNPGNGGSVSDFIIEIRLK